MPGAERPIGPRAATALLLVEGYCALAVEMIALRALVPVAGHSVAVTSLVVTAFLAALALGYRAGGAFAGNAREKVARNLAAAGAWSAFWLSRFGVALAFEATGALPPLVQVAVYAVVGVGPVAYLLAQAVVLLVGSAGPETAPGKAGAAFAASTLGNVAGGLATALVVMQLVGVAGAVALVSGLLVLAALAAWARAGWRLWAAAVVVAGVAGANLVVERDAYVLTTAHADYAVEADAAGARTLRVNAQNASREDGAGTGHAYIEWIEDRVYGNLPEGRPARVLVIGAGGFTFGRGRPGDAAEIVFVDVDARLAPVADAFLAPATRRGRYAAMDGRAYLLRHEVAFEAIVLDAYADRTAVPSHLLTREFFALARSRLSEDGTLYVNLIVAPQPDRLSTRTDRTLRSVFAACWTQELGEASRWRNRVYSCARGALDGDATIYGDSSMTAGVDGGVDGRRD
ncbi:MAG: fused MFS/spermidine synthase [Immundisolibacterales bacterium]|nr:fused MFS/spermidine synthase [Immundisolibacterales bacterium]